MLNRFLLFVTSLLLGFLIVSQFQAKKVADSSISRDSNITYVQQFNLLVSTNDKLRQERETLQRTLEQVRSKVSANQAVAADIQNFENITGINSVSGPGITITINENVEPFWLVDLTNELFLAGSEAISINEFRIDNQTGFAGQALPEPSIYLNNKTLLTIPYTFKAIGDSKTLSQFLSEEQGIINRLNNNYSNTDNAITIEENQNLVLASR